jgi:hypothetical protein
VLLTIISCRTNTNCADADGCIEVLYCTPFVEKFDVIYFWKIISFVFACILPKFSLFCVDSHLNMSVHVTSSEAFL